MEQASQNETSCNFFGGSAGPNQQRFPCATAAVSSSGDVPAEYSGDDATQVQLTTDLGELTRDLQQNVHPKLEALRLAMEKMQVEMDNILGEVKNPVEPRLQLQTLQDRLTLQEQKQKEQDELIRKLLSEKQQQQQLGETTEQDAAEEPTPRGWSPQDTAAIQAAGKERRVLRSGWAFQSGSGPLHAGTSHGGNLQRVCDPLPAENERRWNASVWEMSILVFTQGVGTGASIHVLLLIIVNIIVQFSFTMVVLFNFNDATFTDENLEASRMFRLSIGHSVRFQDSLSRSSLMRRVCDGGFSLDMATKPGTLVEDITEYLALDSDPGVERFFAGELMCTLAVFCWAMVFVAEFERAFSFVWALLSVPVQLSTAYVSDGHHLLQLQGVSWQRYIVAGLLVVIRLFISVSLLIVGSLWLTYTVNVENLILNAVALEFILEVDIMLFALVPSQVKALIFQLQPLLIRRIYAWRGADLQAAFLTIVVFVTAIIMFLGFIEPQRDKMDEVYDILCNGTLDFVFTQDSMGMTFISPAFQRDMYTDLEARLARDSVEQVIKHPLRLDEVEKSEWIQAGFETAVVADLFLEAPSPTQVVSGFDISELVDMVNPLCSDELFEIFPQFRKNFAAISGLDITEENVRCRNLGEYAHTADRLGIIVRNTCPNMAGCTSPLSPVPSLEPSWGCPASCGTQAEIELSRLPCEDTPLDVLLNSSYWSSWVRHIGQQAARLSDNSERLTSYLMTGGCEGLLDVETVSLPAFTRTGLCSGQEWDVHPLAHVCPVSCNCNLGLTQQSLGVCPQACIIEVISEQT